VAAAILLMIFIIIVSSLSAGIVIRWVQKKHILFE
jgi:hypothetical protein